MNTQELCDYCGEPTRAGWYRWNGLQICDDCGDAVIEAIGIDAAISDKKQIP